MDLDQDIVTVAPHGARSMSLSHLPTFKPFSAFVAHPPVQFEKYSEWLSLAKHCCSRKILKEHSRIAEAEEFFDKLHSNFHHPGHVQSPIDLKSNLALSPLSSKKIHKVTKISYSKSRYYNPVEHTLSAGTLLQLSTEISFDYHPVLFTGKVNPNNVEACVYSNERQKCCLFVTSPYLNRKAEYKLVQFHFHFPSEHTIDESHKAMEIHFVHVLNNFEELSVKNQIFLPKISVFGIIINLGKEHPHIDTVWNNVSSKQTTKKPFLFNPLNLLPKNPCKRNWHYIGSLTSPKYTEGLNWFVNQQPITFSKSQIQTFRDLMKNRPNSRVIQLLYDRPVTVIGVDDDDDEKTDSTLDISDSAHVDDSK